MKCAADAGARQARGANRATRCRTSMLSVLSGHPSFLQLSEPGLRYGGVEPKGVLPTPQPLFQNGMIHGSTSDYLPSSWFPEVVVRSLSGMCIPFPMIILVVIDFEFLRSASRNRMLSLPDQTR